MQVRASIGFIQVRVSVGQFKHIFESKIVNDIFS